MLTHQEKSPSASKSPSNSTKELKKSNKVFITNMNSLSVIPDLESKLRNLFSKHGQISDLQVKQNKQKRYSFAFLEMKDPEVIPKMISQCGGIDFYGRKLRVQHQKSNPRYFAQSKDERNNNFQRNYNRHQDYQYNNNTQRINSLQKPRQFDSKQNVHHKHEQKSIYRKRSVTPQNKGQSKGYDGRPKTPEREKNHTKTYQSKHEDDYSRKKNDKSEKRQQRRHHSSSSQSDNYRRNHDSKRNYYNEDSKKYTSSNRRDRSNSRNRYQKEQDSKYERRRDNRDRKDRSSYKKSRDQKDYSSSDSRSSSNDRRRHHKKSDKKKKTRRQDDRSYSPVSRRKYNN